MIIKSACMMMYAAADAQNKGFKGIFSKKTPAVAPVAKTPAAPAAAPVAPMAKVAARGDMLAKQRLQG